jgi:hypothetical protein
MALNSREIVSQRGSGFMSSWGKEFRVVSELIRGELCNVYEPRGHGIAGDL